MYSFPEFSHAFFLLADCTFLLGQNTAPISFSRKCSWAPHLSNSLHKQRNQSHPLTTISSPPAKAPKRGRRGRLSLFVYCRNKKKGDDERRGCTSVLWARGLRQQTFSGSASSNLFLFLDRPSPLVTFHESAFWSIRWSPQAIYRQASPSGPDSGDAETPHAHAVRVSL